MLARSAENPGGILVAVTKCAVTASSGETRLIPLPPTIPGIICARTILIAMIESMSGLALNELVRTATSLGPTGIGVLNEPDKPDTNVSKPWHPKINIPLEIPGPVGPNELTLQVARQAAGCRITELAA